MSVTKRLDEISEMDCICVDGNYQIFCPSCEASIALNDAAELLKGELSVIEKEIAK